MKLMTLFEISRLRPGKAEFMEQNMAFQDGGKQDKCEKKCKRLNKPIDLSSQLPMNVHFSQSYSADS